MIHSLHLDNFKCFEEQTLEFGNLTLLSGLNGMGKSSILQALLLLRQSYQRNLLQTTGLALQGDLVQLGTAKDVLFENAQEERITLAMTLDNYEKSEWSFKYNKEEEVLDYASPPITTPTTFKTGLFTDNFHYLQAERIGPRITFEKSDFLVREHKQLGIRGEYTLHFLEIFGKEDISGVQLAFPNTESRKLNRQVEAWLNVISPGIRLRITEHAHLDLMNLRYSFIREKQAESTPYRATQVGFGITYVLPVIVALLSSKPDTLVLLENPEAHLHPQGQVKMGELIARAATCGIQVLVETHSDHVLNGIRLAVHAGILAPEKVKLHFFQRSQKRDNFSNEIISPKIDRDGRLNQWPDGFFDEWDKSLETLLEPGAR